MIVPIDILKPILGDLLTLGRPNRPPRPWLGLNATEVDDKGVVARGSEGGPSHRANLRSGAIVLAVAGPKRFREECSSMARAPVSKTGGCGFESLHSCHA